MACQERCLLDFCKEGDLANMCTLFEQGVQVDWCDEAGITALHICAAHGFLEGTTHLIKYGADINRASTLGWTPIMQAARNGHSAVIKLLIAAGADVSLCNSLGWDVFSLATTSQNEATINMIFSLADASHLTRALSVSCQLGLIKTVQSLLNRNVHINAQLPPSGTTALMLAASEGHARVVEMLLSHKCDPNITNTNHMTALDMAISCSQNVIQEILTPVTTVRRIPAHVLMKSATVQIQVQPPKPISSNDCYQTSFYSQSHLHHAYSDGFLFPQEKSPSILPLPSSPLFKFPSTPLLYPTHSISSPNNLNSPYCLSASHNHTPLASPNLSVPSCLPMPQTQPTHFDFSPALYNFSYFQQVHTFSVPVASPVTSPLIIPQWVFSHTPYPVESKSCKQENVLQSNKKLKKWWRQLKLRCRLKKTVDIKLKLNATNEDSTKEFSDLDALLKMMKLDSFIPLFRTHEVDLKTFLVLNEADLTEIGITDSDKRLQILNKIKNLNECCR